MKTIKLEPYKSLGHITWEGKRHEIADIEQEAAFELGRVGKNGMKDVPIDAAIVGIVDSVTVHADGQE